MPKTKRRKKIRNPMIWSIVGVACAMLLILVCVFLIMDGSETAQARKTQVTTSEIPYSPDDFVIRNGFMECVSVPYATGIDVSFYQGDIDWQAVKAQGVDFVFIRVGGRGSSEGELFADTKAQEYYTGAKAAGLQIGAYFFSQAISEEEAIQEAEYTLDLIADWELDLPVVFDWEYIDKEARTGKMRGPLLTQCTLAFCQTIENAGLEPMIYFNESQGTDLLNLTQLQQYPFWLAKYNGALDFPHQVDYWQYSETGKVDGINGNVDLNIFIES